MPTPLWQIAQNAENDTFRSMVKAALYAAAFTVIQEDPGAANHAGRAKAARQVLDNPGYFVTNGAWALALLGMNEGTDDTVVMQGIAGYVDAAASLIEITSA